MSNQAWLTSRAWRIIFIICTCSTPIFGLVVVVTEDGTEPWVKFCLSLAAITILGGGIKLAWEKPKGRSEQRFPQGYFVAMALLATICGVLYTAAYVSAHRVPKYTTNTQPPPPPPPPDIISSHLICYRREDTRKFPTRIGTMDIAWSGKDIAVNVKLGPAAIPQEALVLKASPVSGMAIADVFGISYFPLLSRPVAQKDGSVTFHLKTRTKSDKRRVFDGALISPDSPSPLTCQEELVRL